MKIKNTNIKNCDLIYILHLKIQKIKLLILLSGICAASLYAGNNPQNIKWNVLVLMTDMQNVHYLGCDHQGKENIYTPNLDKIGTDGMIFRKAYDAYPVCAPTRASLLTGTYPFKHGQNSNSLLLTEAGPQGKTPALTHIFRDNGYNTAMFGKQHSNLEPLENLPNGTFMGKNVFHGWDFRRYDQTYFQGRVEENRTPDFYPTPAEYNLAIASQNNNSNELEQYKTELTKRYPAEIGTPQPQWEKDLVNKYKDISLSGGPPASPYTYDDAAFVYESLDYLETLAGKRSDDKFGLDRAKPFFLFLSLHKPHYPWVAPLMHDGTEWWYMYSARPDENNKTYLRNGKPAPRIIPNPIIDSLIYEDPTSQYKGTGTNYPEEGMQFARAKYSANISWLDHLFGKVIDKLAELDDPNNPGKKMSETTIICFTADHGDMMGQKERVSKMVSYEGSARVPFLIRMPGVISPGQQSDIIINHVDMFPTLAGLVGLGDKLGNNLDGKDCSKALLANNPALGPQRTFTVVFTQNKNSYPGEIYARTQKYKFTRWNGKTVGNQPAMLLFDMDNDPNETTNLAYNPSYRNIVIEESRACDEFMMKFYPTLQPTIIPNLAQYTLTANANPDKGSINSNPIQGKLSENTVVTLSAKAKEGYKFAGWSGSVTNNTNPLQLVLDGNKTITANFAVDDNKLRVAFDTPGSGTWIVPDGVYSVTVQVWGGGGAGGSAFSGVATSNTQARGGGGAGGSFASFTVSVTPGQIINYTVGKGGAASNEGFVHQTFGGAGGSSYASLNNVTIVSALGGPGGENVSVTNVIYGGAGGAAPKTGNIGDVAFYGGNGGIAGAGGTGGGGGSAGAEGKGGDGSIVTAGVAGLNGGSEGGTGTNLTNQLPTNGNNPGGGGAGATVRNNTPFSSNNTYNAGSNGGNGKIIFAYELSTNISGLTTDSENAVYTYPNPAKNILNVYSKSIDIIKIELVDMIGKTVYHKNNVPLKLSIDVSGIRPGVYIIKAHTTSGLFTLKVIINK